MHRVNETEKKRTDRSRNNDMRERGRERARGVVFVRWPPAKRSNLLLEAVNSIRRVRHGSVAQKSH